MDAYLTSVCSGTRGCSEQNVGIGRFPAFALAKIPESGVHDYDKSDALGCRAETTATTTATTTMTGREELVEFAGRQNREDLMRCRLRQ